MIKPIFFVDDIDSKDMFNIRDNNDIIFMDGIESKRKSFTKYMFYDISVPRVNEILTAVIGKEFLIQWALKLGLEEYTKERKEILMIGSLVHEYIEDFLLKTNKKKTYIYSRRIYGDTMTAFNNFKSWYMDKQRNGFIMTTLYTEVVTTNPWFGGTIDNITNFKHELFNLDKNFIIDYKTSKSISIEYLLQTYAYLWSWNWNRIYINPELPHIDGIMIVRIDKNKENHYEDLVVELNNPIINDLDYGLGAMINWYYSTINLNDRLKYMRKEKCNGNSIIRDY